MLTRRSVLLSTAALTVAFALRLAPAQAQGAQVATAVDFVHKTGDELIGIINGSGTLASKQTQLLPIIDKSVDVDGIAAFCLGRYMRTATPQQQKDYLALFHNVLLKSVSGKLGEYAGVRLTVGRGDAREDGQVVVSTVIERPNNQPNNVDWLIETQGGAPKIIDVVAEGTSLRLTQRSDYNSYLSRNGGNVQALIDAMKRQVGA